MAPRRMICGAGGGRSTGSAFEWVAFPSPERSALDLRLAIFDCDGTLADSEATIVDSVVAAFADHGLPPPTRAGIVSKIGLSLEDFVDHVAPALDPAARMRVLESYRSNFSILRERRGADPLFAGILPLLDRLGEHGVLLGIATGKSRRGLDRFLDAHGITTRFATLQTADDAPSKPHPAMIERALDETGTDPRHAVMIGDTTFDMGAAVNAGVRAIGVEWGHHGRVDLIAAGASCVVSDARALGRALLPR